MVKHWGIAGGQLASGTAIYKYIILELLYIYYYHIMEIWVNGITCSKDDDTKNYTAFIFDSLTDHMCFYFLKI